MLNRCHQLGVLIVAAAGNDGCDCLHIPAAHPSILAVGAATVAGQPLDWSNWGKQYQGHAVLAVGENVRGASLGGKVSQRSGTSSAAAIVSGVAGLMMSIDLGRGIKPHGPRIRRLLLQSADPCPSTSPSICRRYLSGVLNIDRALNLVSREESVMSLNEFNNTRDLRFDEVERRDQRERSDGGYASMRPAQMGQPESMAGSRRSRCDHDGNRVCRLWMRRRASRGLRA